jgi:hypothetical protein
MNKSDRQTLFSFTLFFNMLQYKFIFFLTLVQIYCMYNFLGGTYHRNTCNIPVKPTLYFIIHVTCIVYIFFQYMPGFFCCFHCPQRVQAKRRCKISKKYKAVITALSGRPPSDMTICAIDVNACLSCTTTALIRRQLNHERGQTSTIIPIRSSSSSK